MPFVQPTFSMRLQLLWGVIRRLWLHIFCPGYVRTSRARRLGECRRCGACCQLFRPCPHLQYDQGVSACRLYGRYRAPNCRTFPIDSRDLADRDLIAPQTPCGFSWLRTEKVKAAPLTKSAHEPMIQVN